VKYDENNFPTNIKLRGNSKRKKWKEIWLIQAALTWPQPNDYICGTVALNRFAFELHKFQSNQAVDETTLQLIRSQEKLKDNNFRNASDLLEHLLKTQMSVLSPLDTEEMQSDDDSDMMTTFSEDESLPLPKMDDSPPGDESPPTANVKDSSCTKQNQPPANVDDSSPTNDATEEEVTSKLQDVKKDKDSQASDNQDEEPVKNDTSGVSRKRKAEKRLKQMTQQSVRRSERPTSLAATFQSINSTTERLREMINSPRKKRKKNMELSGTKCFAGDLCRQQQDEVVLDGKTANGEKCHVCQQACHYTCLYKRQTEEKIEVYCTRCFRKDVVQVEDASVTFEELLCSNKTRRGKAKTIPIAGDCKKFVDNYLREHRMEMTSGQYLLWIDEKNRYLKKKENKQFKSREEKRAYFEKVIERDSTRTRYESVIKLGIEEYMLSTDGVVTALRFDEKQNKFFAMVKYYDLRDELKELSMEVTEDWVMDTYGLVLTKKLMDRAENDGFLLPPTDAHGTLATVKVNDDKVVRLKFVPATF
jgi:hypothetical protein